MKLIVRDAVTGKKAQLDISDLPSGNANVVLADTTCLASVFVGAAVIMDVGGFAVNAQANSLANSNVIGVVEAKSSSTLCDIRVLGVSLSVFTGLDVAKVYFLSDSVAGLITDAPPTASGSIILSVGQPFSATEMLINKGQRTVRI